VTLSTDQMAVLAILTALLLLLVWGRWRYDVVAFAALLACVVAGVVPAGEAFSGFGHLATITVAMVLIVSRALTSSGATDWIARLIAPTTKQTSTHVGALSAVAAALSAFMNNVGTLGLLMPVALQSAAKAKRAAATLLMPLSFGSILGELVTLIGTPPNIIIATYRGQVSGEAFGMFDFTPVGGVTALAGVAFVALVGWRLMPARRRVGAVGEDLFDIDDYLAEARIPKDCDLVGKSLRELEQATEKIDAQVVGLVRDGHRFIASPGRRRLRAGDVLAIEASPQELDRFVAALGLELTDAHGRTPGEDGGNPVSTGVAELVEAVVAPRSRIEGRTAMSLHLPRRFGVHLLGVSRQGKPHRNRLGAFRFRMGDVLLLFGESDHMSDALTRLGCLPLAGRDISFGRRGDARPQIAIFAVALALASFGLLPIPIALALAVAVMVVANLIPLRDLYEGVDWSVIVLLGALIPVGGALETTGTTDLIATGILALTAGLAPAMVLALVLVVTMTLSDILNNAATAVVMAPIAVGIAERLGTASDPFLMTVAVGASCAFLTPIGHQNNALIMGPGGYEFGDYWRMGLPLEVLIVLVSVPMILLVWPL